MRSAWSGPGGGADGGQQGGGREGEPGIVSMALHPVGGRASGGRVSRPGGRGGPVAQGLQPLEEVGLRRTARVLPLDVRPAPGPSKENEP
jgi:hypothetical protein